MIEKTIAFRDEIWEELRKRYGDRLQEYINDLLEKDLFGTDLIRWLTKKVEETPKKTVTEPSPSK